jgi:hypothetical protein
MKFVGAENMCVAAEKRRRGEKTGEGERRKRERRTSPLSRLSSPQTPFLWDTLQNTKITYY